MGNTPHQRLWHSLNLPSTPTSFASFNTSAAFAAPDPALALAAALAAASNPTAALATTTAEAAALAS